MIIGIPKEIKIRENRVAATPAVVSMLTETGHQVLVEKNAGVGSGFSNNEYEKMGGKIVPIASKAWDAEMVMKIKEPIELEYKMFHKDLLLFTYLHLANPDLRELTFALMKKEVSAIAYESVRLPDGSLPLLEPMSEVAGKMATQIGAHLLEKTYGGRGILLGGIIGVPPCEVVVIGAGTVGYAATQIALGMGANVTVLNRGYKRLRHLVETLGLIHPGNLNALKLNSQNLLDALKKADLVVGAVLTPSARAPILVNREMIKSMKTSSVIVDVSIDQGGIFETSRPTTHEDPVYVEEGIIHYCVTNMPGAVPRTSTFGITNATLPYAIKLANVGFIDAMKSDSALAEGVNVYAGYVTNKAVAEAHGLEYHPLKTLI